MLGMQHSITLQIPSAIGAPGHGTLDFVLPQVKQPRAPTPMLIQGESDRLNQQVHS